MSDIQKILKALAAAYHDNLIGEESCDGLCTALNGVPTEYHYPALMAMLGVDMEVNNEP